MPASDVTASPQSYYLTVCLSALQTNNAAPSADAASADPEKAQNGDDSVVDPEIYFTYSAVAGFWVLGLWLVLFLASIAARTYATSLAAQVAGTFYFVGSIIFGAYIRQQCTSLLRSGSSHSSAFCVYCELTSA